MQPLQSTSTTATVPQRSSLFCSVPVCAGCSSHYTSGGTSAFRGWSSSSDLLFLHNQRGNKHFRILSGHFSHKWCQQPMLRAFSASTVVQTRCNHCQQWMLNSGSQFHSDEDYPFLTSEHVWTCSIALSFAWETILSKNTKQQALLTLSKTAFLLPTLISHFPHWTLLILQNSHCIELWQM